MSVADIGLSWSKAELLVSLGKGRTFAVFQILWNCWVTKETFKVSVITCMSSKAYASKTKKASHLGYRQSFSHATMP